MLFVFIFFSVCFVFLFFVGFFILILLGSFHVFILFNLFPFFLFLGLGALPAVAALVESVTLDRNWLGEHGQRIDFLRFLNLFFSLFYNQRRFFLCLGRCVIDFFRFRRSRFPTCVRLFHCSVILLYALAGYDTDVAFPDRFVHIKLGMKRFRAQAGPLLLLPLNHLDVRLCRRFFHGSLPFFLQLRHDHFVHLHRSRADRHTQHHAQ